MAEILNIGLEQGVSGTDEFDSIVQAGSATAAIAAAAAQADTGFGVLYTPDSTSLAYGLTAFTDFTGTDHRARVYIDASNWNLTSGSDYVFLQLLGTNNTVPVTEIVLTQDSGTYKIWAQTWNNSSAFVPTTTEPTFDRTTPHWVEVHVFRSATVGFVKLYVDGVEVAASAASIANNTAEQPDTLRLGLCSAVAPASASTLDLDECVIRDDSTEIGPYTGQPEGMITHEGVTEGATTCAEYSPIVNASDDLTFVAAAAAAGTGFGMKIVHDEVAEDYGVQSSVAFPVDSIYRLRIYANLENLTMTNGDNFNFIDMRGASNNQLSFNAIKAADVISVNFNRTAGTGTPTWVVTSGWHRFEVLCDLTGGGEVWVDGESVGTWTGGSNTAITEMRVGATAGLDSGTGGHTFIDEIAWRPYNVEIGAWTANILDVDFETGAVTEKAGVETTEGATGIAVNPTAALKSSNFGAAFDLDANDDSYITYTLPGVAATTMRARFYFDLNTWADTDAAQVTGPLMFRASTNDQFGLKTEVNSGTETINGWYRTNSGTVQMTTETAVTSGWIEMEYCWHASAGYFKWWLDGVLQEEDTGLATDSVTVPDTVRLGWYTVGAGGDGVAYLDELIVRNQASSPIGTDGAGAGFVASSSGASPLRFFLI